MSNRSFALPPRLESPGTSDFYSVLTTIVRAGGIGAAQKQADAGELRLTDRAERVLTKALVGAGNVSGWIGGDLNVLREGFYASLASSSAFFGLLPSMRKIPFYARIASVTQTLTAGVVAEGAPVPVQAITIGKPILEPTKISLITWLTMELAETLEAGPLIRQELTAAASRAVDAEFVNQLVAAGIPTTVASGTTLAADLALMINTVITSAAAKPSWVASVDTAASLAFATTGWTGSTVSPLGGTLMGLPLLVSDGVPGSSMLLIDAAAIAANSGPIDLSTSTSATLDPNTAPSLPPAMLVNLFSTNSIAFKIVVGFGAEPMRATAAHLLTDVAAWDTPA